MHRLSHEIFENLAQEMKILSQIDIQARINLLAFLRIVDKLIRAGRSNF